jgi:hypothetical protein
MELCRAGELLGVANQSRSGQRLAAGQSKSERLVDWRTAADGSVPPARRREVVGLEELCFFRRIGVWQGSEEANWYDMIAEEATYKIIGSTG